jgi:hypothetical protein
VTRDVRWKVEVPRGWTPRGWRGGRGPGVDLLAVAPGPVRPVAAHVLLAFERLPTRIALETLAARSVAQIDEMGTDVQILGAAALGEGSSRDGALDRCVRIVTFADRRGATEVAQVIAFVSPRCHDDAGRDVAQFVGTCEFDELPRYADAFTAVIESLAVRP